MPRSVQSATKAARARFKDADEFMIRWVCMGYVWGSGEQKIADPKDMYAKKIPVTAMKSESRNSAESTDHPINSYPTTLIA